ncbi:MAG TPA: murein transglycosylase A [Kofleriaceae bacterium]|nr:murein transglycosylase A [Kofleriaceae bacterium]
MSSPTARFLALSIVCAAGCRSQHLDAERPRPPVAPTAPEVRPIATTPALPAPVENHLVLDEVAFAALPGWDQDEVGKALPAFVRSCRKLRRLGDGERVGRTDTGGVAGDWRRACARADRIAATDHAAARAFFESEFVPFLASNNGDPVGRFTGYYEARLRGSRRRHGRYRIPLHRRPPDLVTVELSKFLDDARGRRLAGRVVGRKLEPYDTRADIVGGSLAGKKLELIWLDDAVDAFFVQVQGSGHVRLDTGEGIRIGYAATNGHRYTAIGRVLIAEGHLSRETVSMQSIRAYLEAHPERADQVMNQNASYVFFEIIEGDGPLGSQGVVLTDGRSIAIDRNFIPQSAPVWLDTVAPVAGVDGEQPLRRLVIAQDTGGAILGPVRADVYWGGDEAAADVAGRMKSTGRYFVLLPLATAARLRTRT